MGLVTIAVKEAAAGTASLTITMAETARIEDIAAATIGTATVAVAEATIEVDTTRDSSMVAETITKIATTRGKIIMVATTVEITVGMLRIIQEPVLVHHMNQAKTPRTRSRSSEPTLPFVSDTIRKLLTLVANLNKDVPTTKEVIAVTTLPVAMEAVAVVATPMRRATTLSSRTVASTTRCRTMRVATAMTTS